jgi:hypothetical protein
MAADNLQHFIDGSGETVKYPFKTLNQFKDFRTSLSRQLGYYVKAIVKAANTLEDGKSVTITPSYNAVVDARFYSELFYASGLSEISGDGVITLTRKGSQIIITGDIKQRWHDGYNWNEGASAYIPGFGEISDDDGLYLKENGGAHDFQLRSFWHITVSGSFSSFLSFYNSDIHFVHRDNTK